MVETYYLVCMRKNTRTETPSFFVCTKNKRDEFNLVSVFHGVGYWHKGVKKAFDNIEDREEEEVWIPWSNIDYVQSLMYKPKK